MSPSVYPRFQPSRILDDASGIYRLRAKCDGSIICDMPVHVVWVGHESKPQPFLGIKTNDPDELRGALGVLVGKRLELEFVPETEG